MTYRPHAMLPTLPTDLKAYVAPSWWHNLHDEEQSRIAGALSVTAIVMLLVTSFTLARGPINAAPQVAVKVSDVARGSTPRHRSLAVAAPFDCPRLQGRQWLRVAIWQQGDMTLAGWECIYGHSNAQRFVP